MAENTITATRPLDVYALASLAVVLLAVGVFFIAQASALTASALSDSGASATMAATQASRSWTAGWALVQSGLFALVAALAVWRR